VKKLKKDESASFDKIIKYDAYARKLQAESVFSVFNRIKAFIRGLLNR